MPVSTLRLERHRTLQLQRDADPGAGGVGGGMILPGVTAGSSNKRADVERKHFAMWRTDILWLLAAALRSLRLRFIGVRQGSDVPFPVSLLALLTEALRRGRGRARRPAVEVHQRLARVARVVPGVVPDTVASRSVQPFLPNTHAHTETDTRTTLRVETSVAIFRN